MLLFHLVRRFTLFSSEYEYHKMQAALMFEVLMYLNSYYFGLFTIWEFITYLIKLAFKGNTTYFKDDNASKMMVECAVFFLFCIFEMGRIYLGRKSDSTDKPVYIIFSLLLVIPSSGSVIYLLFEQLVIVRLEKMLCCFQLLMEICELFFGVIHLITYKADKY